jgi:hypothetical protein
MPDGNPAIGQISPICLTNPRSTMNHETNEIPANDTATQSQPRANYEAPVLENLGVWAGMVGTPVGISMQP